MCINYFVEKRGCDHVFFLGTYHCHLFPRTLDAQHTFYIIDTGYECETCVASQQSKLDRNDLPLKYYPPITESKPEPVKQVSSEGDHTIAPMVRRHSMASLSDVDSVTSHWKEDFKETEKDIEFGGPSFSLRKDQAEEDKSEEIEQEVAKIHTVDGSPDKAKRSNRIPDQPTDLQHQYVQDLPTTISSPSHLVHNWLDNLQPPHVRYSSIQTVDHDNSVHNQPDQLQPLRVRNASFHNPMRGDSEPNKYNDLQQPRVQVASPQTPMHHNQTYGQSPTGPCLLTQEASPQTATHKNGLRGQPPTGPRRLVQETSPQTATQGNRVPPTAPRQMLQGGSRPYSHMSPNTRKHRSLVQNQLAELPVHLQSSGYPGDSMLYIPPPSQGYFSVPHPHSFQPPRQHVHYRSPTQPHPHPQAPAQSCAPPPPPTYRGPPPSGPRHRYPLRRY